MVRFGHGAGFALTMVLALVMWSLALAVYFYPLAAQLAFTVGFLFALGMMLRAHHRLAWCWTAVGFGACAVVLQVLG